MTINGPSAHIGEGSFSHSPLERNVRVGKYSNIAENVFFHYADNHLCAEDKKVVFTSNKSQSFRTELIIIGNDVWVGRGVKFLQGVRVGDGAIIGAWTVVAKDVPAYSVFVGNPGRVKKYRFSKTQVAQLLQIKWWDWEEKEIEKSFGLLHDVDLFLQTYGWRDSA